MEIHKKYRYNTLNNSRMNIRRYVTMCELNDNENGRKKIKDCIFYFKA